MPYDPGIRNISGELLAQGQMRQAEGIAGGLVNWLKGYEQNQSLKKQGMSTFAGALANNPDLQQFMDDAEAGRKQVPPELLKAFANAKKGDVDVYDASMLGNFANNFLTTKREAAQEQAIRMQTASHAVQALGQLADLGFFAKQPGSGISPEDVSNLQRFITSGMGQGNRQTMAAPQAGITALDQFIRRQAPAGPTPSTDMQQAEPQAEAQPSEPLPEGAIQTGRRSREAQMAEAMQTVQSLPPSQQRRSLNTVLADIQKRDLDLSKNISFNDPAKAAAYADRLNSQSKTPGIRFVVDTDPRTGYNIVKQMASSVETPEDAARRKALESESVGRVDIANAQAKEDIKTGASARKTAVAAERLSGLLEGGQFQTGKGQEFVNTARGWAKSLGLNVDESKLAATNEGIAYINQLLLPIYESQKGAISNREQALYQAMGPGMEKDEAANKALLTTMIERSKADRELERNAQSYASGDLTHVQYMKQRQKILDAFDAKVPELSRSMPAPSATQAAGGAAPANESAADMAARLIRQAKGK